MKYSVSVNLQLSKELRDVLRDFSMIMDHIIAVHLWRAYLHPQLTFQMSKEVLSSVAARVTSSKDKHPQVCILCLHHCTCGGTKCGKDSGASYSQNDTHCYWGKWAKNLSILGRKLGGNEGS